VAKAKSKVKFTETNSIPIDKYLERGGEVVPRTVRAPAKLWELVEGLATIKNVSVNLLIVAALEKVCDEEGFVR
jgi:hypothetical protein